MRTIKVINDPEAFQLLGDETRRRILYLLRAKPMTVSQIAEELNLTPQAIYHHIRKMKEAGLVEVAREERVEHFIETYYQAAAELFHFTMGKRGNTAAEATTTEALKSLEKLGFRVRTDPAVVSKVVGILQQIEEVEGKGKWGDKVAELEDVDFTVKQELEHYAAMLSMTDGDFNNFLRLMKEHRKLLKSLLVEEPEAKAKVAATA